MRLEIVNDYLLLPIGSESPKIVTAVVEIPMGSVNKYEYDKALKVFRLDRRLHSSVHYPGDFGFIPSTIARNGDPLNVLILTHSPTFPGCVVQVRPIGVLEITHRGVTDEKILAVAIGDPQLAAIDDTVAVYPHLLNEIENFFEVYQELEGTKTETHGWRDAERARALIVEANNTFTAQRKRG
jgi:inorganic pyrophosphatase